MLILGGDIGDRKSTYIRLVEQHSSSRLLDLAQDFRHYHRSTALLLVSMFSSIVLQALRVELHFWCFFFFCMNHGSEDIETLYMGADKPILFVKFFLFHVYMYYICQARCQLPILSNLPRDGPKS